MAWPVECGHTVVRAWWARADDSRVRQASAVYVGESRVGSATAASVRRSKVCVEASRIAEVRQRSMDTLACGCCRAYMKVFCAIIPTSYLEGGGAYIPPPFSPHPTTFNRCSSRPDVVHGCQARLALYLYSASCTACATRVPLPV